MKPPHARKPRFVSTGAKITDRSEMMSLVQGHKEAWKRLGRPEVGGKAEITAVDYERSRRQVLKEAPISSRSGPFDEEVGLAASVDAWRRAQHERVRWLLLNDILGEPALSSAQSLKRHHEGREWRQPY